MNDIITAAKNNVCKDFSLDGVNYFCDVDSDDTLFITVERNGNWEVLMENIEL